jgi:ribonuclease-3
MNVTDDPLADLQLQLEHEFSDPGLLREALRHSSAEAAADRGSYERLEFLGDAVLGHAIALLLFRRHPDADQGGLTRMKAQLIRSTTLARKARELGLGQLVELGRGEETLGGRERPALLEDVFEAVVGALALDAGWDRANAFAEKVFATEVERLDERTLALANPKTVLQEVAQSRGLPLPEYRQVAEGGPEHRPTWAFEVVWDGRVLARGEGRTKRTAQQEAARRALLRLGLV